MSFEFVLALCFECFALFYLYKIIQIVVTHYIGSCLMILAFAKDLKQGLLDLNKAYKTNGNAKELNERLREWIQFHSDTKQLGSFVNFILNSFRNLRCIDHSRCINEFADTQDLIILGNFIWSIIAICGTLLGMDAELVE